MRELDGNERSGFLEVQVFISLLFVRTICNIGKADLFVKLGGNGSNLGNDKLSKLFTKAMPIIAESHFSWSKNSISFDTGVRGGGRLVLKCAKLIFRTL